MIKSLAKKSLRRVKKILGHSEIPFHTFTINSASAADLAKNYDHDIGRLFFSNTGPVVHKWTQYLDVYEMYFSKYRDTNVKMLEIGVSNGGSLNMWRKYLGGEATIYGIDINPECAKRVSQPNKVRIGSQTDPKFLRAVVDEMGELDIVIDDGSHVAEHQKISFDALFPLLKDGGLYIIEDTHTAYWRDEFNGGYRRAGTAIEQTKIMIDDMHAWYHGRPQSTPARDWIRAIHVYDSIIVIEKKKITKPGHIRIGTEL
jgi:cephalosporin hydroxylase